LAKRYSIEFNVLDISLVNCVMYRTSHEFPTLMKNTVEVLHKLS